MSRERFDPFAERRPRPRVRVEVIAGVTVRFESTDKKLLALAGVAFGGFRGKVSRRAPKFRVTLVRTRDVARWRGGEPPRPRLAAGGGLLHGAVDAANFALIDPPHRTALVAVSPAMLRFPYHVRYELIEFAVLTLLSRALPRVPLHAAAVAIGARCVLLLGNSGAGKSTACLEAFAQGWEVVGEDSLLVDPRTLRIAGVPAFLHVRPKALRHVRGSPLAAAVRGSPVIRRRSGERKFEFELRRGRPPPEAGPRELAAVVVLSTRLARGQKLLHPISAERAARALTATQPYARGRPEWHDFLYRARAVPSFELRRGEHPRDGVRALRELVDGSVTTRVRRGVRARARPAS